MYRVDEPAHSGWFRTSRRHHQRRHENGGAIQRRNAISYW